ncbi:Peptidase C39 domain-containing protein [Rubrivivax sp. A210]|uniref:C39 family peptidase n=1 Tax=Rubrivivax sp. A210 TaxID=2772301 RepID=UPI00191B1DB6|nr:C39 family peptidase [Rubrivivax sp. A210]CAD5369826.1 Peptidase C39 domain-containing protein [Rubrivivax sp. A210]
MLAQASAMAIAVLALLCSTPAQGASASVEAGTAKWQQPLRSVRDQRDDGLVRQAFDYSCGSAALATLLTFALDDPVDEAWVLKAVLEPLAQDQQALLKKDGLSLLDLQRVAESRGHRAQGFRIGVDGLSRVSRPLIVFIKPGGYRHFAVLKGVRNGRAYLADPSLGNVRMPLYRFVDMWADDKGRGIVFAVERRQGPAPDASALRLAPEGTPLEVLSARHLLEVGSPGRTVHSIR